jgi:hypothetical protein
MGQLSPVADCEPAKDPDGKKYKKDQYSRQREFPYQEFHADAFRILHRKDQYQAQQKKDDTGLYLSGNIT